MTPCGLGVSSSPLSLRLFEKLALATVVYAFLLELGCEYGSDLFLATRATSPYTSVGAVSFFNLIRRGGSLLAL